MAKKAHTCGFIKPFSSTNSRASSSAPSRKPTTPATAVSLLASDPIVGYKIRVLFHDLHNMPKDRACEARTLSTTDDLYLSPPYFTSDEASLIKTAVLDHPIPSLSNLDEDVDSQVFHNSTESLAGKNLTVEETIHQQMATFFDKRRASGDARPCGPHAIAPLIRPCLASASKSSPIRNSWDACEDVALRKTRTQDKGRIQVAKGKIRGHETQGMI